MSVSVTVPVPQLEMSIPVAKQAPTPQRGDTRRVDEVRSTLPIR